MSIFDKEPPLSPNADIELMLGFCIGVLVSRGVSREYILGFVDTNIAGAEALAGKEHEVIQVVERLHDLAKEAVVPNDKKD